MKIIDRYRDSENRFSVVLIINDETPMMLKFQEEIIDEEIYIECQKILDLQELNNVTEI